jgi:hypothetical protein
MPGLTIDQGVQVLALLFFAGLVAAGLIGWNLIQSARKLRFFILRRERISRGWRLITLSLVFAALGIATQFYGKEVAYTIIPPTPSMSPTATVTPTASITPTPSITPTASITPTPSITPIPTETTTPILPVEAATLLPGTHTPDPGAVFSEIEVTARLGNFNQALDASVEFVSPPSLLYGAFSYNFLRDGIQWSAVWYRNDEIICLEAIPWDGGSGGFGYTECELIEWQPGDYTIHLFWGDEWKVSTQFTVLEPAQ